MMYSGHSVVTSGKRNALTENEAPRFRNCCLTEMARFGGLQT